MGSVKTMLSKKLDGAWGFFRELTDNTVKIGLKLRSWGAKAFIYLMLVNGAFLFLIPIIYMLIISVFSPEDFADPSIRWVPVHFNWDNYLRAFGAVDYLNAAGRTTLLTMVGIFGQTIFCSLAGYALARLKFPGKKLITGAVVLLLVIPAQALILPNYVFYMKLNLHHTFWPMILPEALGNGLYGALFVFIFRQVFLGIPAELEDAAAIDGAGVFRTFRVIIAPLAKTAYVTVALFSFVWHWNEYNRPFYYLAQETQTLTMALTSLFNTSPYGRYIPPAFEIQGAAIILAMAPVILIYILVQKYFVESISLTGIKL